jgi:hypothetical protein
VQRLIISIKQQESSFYEIEIDSFEEIKILQQHNSIHSSRLLSCLLSLSISNQSEIVKG